MGEQTKIRRNRTLQAGIPTFSLTARHTRRRNDEIGQQAPLRSLPEDMQPVADLHFLEVAKIGVELFQRLIVRLVLGVGQFNWQDTQLTAASLGMFSVSIFAFSLVPFLLRLFFSFQDVKTPTVIGLIYMVLTVLSLFLFVWLFSS